MKWLYKKIADFISTLPYSKRKSRFVDRLLEKIKAPLEVPTEVPAEHIGFSKTWWYFFRWLS